MVHLFRHYFGSSFPPCQIVNIKFDCVTVAMSCLYIAIMLIIVVRTISPIVCIKMHSILTANSGNEIRISRRLL